MLVLVSHPSLSFLSPPPLSILHYMRSSPKGKHGKCSECGLQSGDQFFNIIKLKILTFNLMCRTSLADKKIIANSYHQAFVLLLSVGRFLIGNPLEMTISIIVIRYCFSHLPACKHLFAGKELIRNIH